VGAFIGVTALSSLVYGHHMFTTGMSPLLGESFMVLTMIISVPAVLLFLKWLGTLWRGAIRLDTPMLTASGSCSRSAWAASRPVPRRHHGGPVPARHLLRRRALHLIMAAAVLLAIFGA